LCMTEYKFSWCIATLILNPCTRGGRVSPHNPVGISVGTQLGWPQSRSEILKRKMFFLLLVFEPQTVQPVAKPVHWLHYSGSRIPLYFILRNVKKVRAVLAGQGHYTFVSDRHACLWHTLFSAKLKLAVTAVVCEGHKWRRASSTG
jgi:hypothetical protein